jgi:hypothetical protein
VASQLDLDPAEPRRQGGRRRRQDGQPAVPVDEADDLAQHGNEVAVA